MRGVSIVSSFHPSWSCHAAAGLLASDRRSPRLPRPLGPVALRSSLPFHSGEDHTGFAPVSRTLRQPDASTRLTRTFRANVELLDMSFTRLLRPRRIVVLALAGALVALAAGPSPGASLPDSHTQPLADGCQRSDAMQLALATPEWTYVNRAQVLAARAAGDATAGNKTVVGTVLGMHPAGDDLYINHDYNDIDIDVAPDAAHADLAATGNGGHELGLEWEATHIPVWAWPQPGDGIRASGSWIWDCGHWGNGPADEDTGGVSELLPYDPEETVKDVVSPGAIAGEPTELHPLHEVATFRKDAP